LFPKIPSKLITPPIIPPLPRIIAVESRLHRTFRGSGREQSESRAEEESESARSPPPPAFAPLGGRFPQRPKAVTGAPYREMNSKLATAPKLKEEDKDRVNNSRRRKTVKLNIIKLEALLNWFSRAKAGYRSRMPNA